MFSGIVEELGVVKEIVRKPRCTLLEIRAGKVPEDARAGDSIAVNGVCLTVIKNATGVLSFEAIPETIQSTNLGSLKIAEKVNLERSLKAGERLCGHFVTGHVDCLGIIRKKFFVRNNLSFEVSVPAEYLRFLLPKGSVAVDGISLTLADKVSAGFRIYVIPHTLTHTTLSFKGHSHKVNVEFDILAKRAYP